MKFAAVMISCKERDEIRAQTIANLSKTDWPFVDRLIVSMFDSGHERPQERQHLNARHALGLGLATGARFILFLEDDLEFNRHLHHNLLNWMPIQYGGNDFTMGSLYNPNIQRLLSRPDNYFFEANPNAVYGSQAYVFSRSAAAYIEQHWHSVEGMQDIKMSRLSAKLGKPIYYFIPSLVQHVGHQSTFGGRFHYTTDFDAGFKI